MTTFYGHSQLATAYKLGRATAEFMDGRVCCPWFNGDQRVMWQMGFNDKQKGRIAHEVYLIKGRNDVIQIRLEPEMDRDQRSKLD